MTALFKIIKKNLKLLIRSKSSALIIILGPLLVIFLVGLAFDNSSQFSLKVGTYSSQYSQLSDDLIKNMIDADFKVRKYPIEEDCINKVKTGEIHACISFPPGLKIESGTTKDVLFHVDYSKINLVYAILDTLSQGVSQQSSAVSMDLTSNLLGKMQAAKKDLYELRPKIVNLKTQTQNTIKKTGELSKLSTSAKSSSELFSTTSDELKNNFLEKAVNAQKDLDTIKNRVENSNATDNQKSTLIRQIEDVNTYMYNIEAKIKDENNAHDLDWPKMEEDLTNIQSKIFDLSTKISSIKTGLDNSNSGLDDVQNKINEIHDNLGNIQVSNAETIVNPIQTSIKPVVSEKSYLSYMFPGLLVLVIMFISILLSNTLVMMEKHSPAYFRNFITPTKNITFILATFLTNLLLVSLQVIIIIMISAFVFKANLFSALPVTIPLIILITSFFTLLGMIIGYVFNSEETSTLAAISVGSIFLFLSSMIVPMESMPKYIQNIAQYAPFALSESMLRKSIIFNVGFDKLIPEVYYLLGGILVLFLVCWFLQKIARTHLIHHLNYLVHKRKKKK